MSDERYNVEPSVSWVSVYGGLLQHLQVIGRNLDLINHYKNLENDALTIVDYGCACGYFLQILRLVNPKHDVYGIDIDPDVVQHARNNLGQDRIFCQSCEEKIPLKDNSVDLILCFELVEHIADNENLVLMFNEWNRLLKSDGYAFVTTPNCSFQQRVVFSLMGRKWIFKDPLRHPNVFNERRLRALVEPYLSLHHVIYSLKSYKFPGPLSRIASLLASCKISSRLIFVLTRKRQS
jgi:2-polyprenyl-3-methyl-5-hydroxy-6-metoxy-1,4-benzoquinol methylase